MKKTTTEEKEKSVTAVITANMIGLDTRKTCSFFAIVSCVCVCVA